MMRSNPEAVRRLLERLHASGAFPDRPIIQRFQVEEDNDSTGTPAYYITALLDDATSDEELTSEHIGPIENLIFEKVFRGADERWPFTRTIRESELQMAVEE